MTKPTTDDLLAWLGMEAVIHRADPGKQVVNQLRDIVAAYPQMREALKSALLVLSHVRDGQSWHENFAKDIEFARQAARAALAAAPEVEDAG